MNPPSVNRRTFAGACLVLGSCVVVGCLGFGEDESKNPPDVLEAFFDALDEPDLDAAEAYLHPESPISLEAIDLTLYETRRVASSGATWADPERDPTVIESTIPDPILEDDDRTVVGTLHSIPRPDDFSYYAEGVYEIRREDDGWLVYEEIDGDAEALAADPFPEY